MKEQIYHVVEIGASNLSEEDAKTRFERKLNQYPLEEYELVGYTYSVLETSTVYTAIFKKHQS